MAARIVGISRALGAGGAEIGKLVADELGFRYVDEEIVARAAELGGVDQDLVADAEERRTLARRVLELLAVSGPTTPSYHLEDLSGDPQRALIVEVIRQLADEAPAVIVAHAASLALAGRQDLLRVLVTAPPELRARRLAEDEGVDEREGNKLVERSDAARAAYLRAFYRVKEELPTHYDLVVNTETLSPGDAAQLIVAAAGFSLDGNEESPA